jgi:hypothetical protein
MKSITIHGIDEPLVKMIEAKARSEGQSVNKTIKKVLEEALGVIPRDKGANRKDFEAFSGVWSNSELAEFEKEADELRTIDPDDWR